MFEQRRTPTRTATNVAGKRAKAAFEKPEHDPTYISPEADKDLRMRFNSAYAAALNTDNNIKKEGFKKELAAANASWVSPASVFARTPDAQLPHHSDMGIRTPINPKKIE